jgi:hypothetical protein
MLDVTVPDVPQIQIAIGQGKRISHFKIIMPVSGEGKFSPGRVGLVKRRAVLDADEAVPGRRLRSDQSRRLIVVLTPRATTKRQRRPFPMAYSVRSVRMKISPFENAGDAMHCSPRSFLAITSAFRPARSTSISPVSLSK